MYTFRTEELRDIITGKTKFKKCLNCNSEGQVPVGVIGELDGVELSAKQLSELNKGDYWWDDCNECDGLGYKPI